MKIRWKSPITANQTVSKLGPESRPYLFNNFPTEWTLWFLRKRL